MTFLSVVKARHVIATVAGFSFTSLWFGFFLIVTLSLIHCCILDGVCVCVCVCVCVYVCVRSLCTKKHKLSLVHRIPFHENPNVHVLEKTVHSMNILVFELNALKEICFVFSKKERIILFMWK
jgi:hypothetical protein